MHLGDARAPLRGRRPGADTAGELLHRTPRKAIGIGHLAPSLLPPGPMDDPNDACSLMPSRMP